MNNMGGMYVALLNDNAKDILEFTQSRAFCISSTHSSSVENTKANKKMSWVFSDNTEWMLSHKLFTNLCEKFQFNPQVDLFAICLDK